MTEITHILQAIDGGEAGAADRLLELVYAELRQVAASHLAHERVGHTLVPTALVHEAYLRLLGGSAAPQWETRGYFFASAAEAMRRILVDHARRKRSQKRGGDWQRSAIPLLSLPDLDQSERLLDLDEALSHLAQQEPQVAQLVKLRYYAGLSIEDAAQSRGVSPRTAVSWWTYARAFLAAEMIDDDTGDQGKAGQV